MAFNNIVQRLHYSYYNAYITSILPKSCRDVFGDQPPPHVHIQLSDGRDCIVEIETRHFIGKISFREIREALNWIEIEQKFLNSEWQRCNS